MSDEWVGKILVLLRDGSVKAMDAEVLTDAAGQQHAFFHGRPAEDIEGCIAAGVYRVGHAPDLRGFLPFLQKEIAAWQEKWAAEPPRQTWQFSTLVSLPQRRPPTDETREEVVARMKAAAPRKP